MLRLVDRTVAYGARKALDGISLEIREGERVAVVGRNGAGKTTLLRELLSLSVSAEHPLCAYVPPDESPVFAMSCRDYVMLGRTPHLGAWRRPSPEDEDAVDGALEAVGMAAFRRRSMDGISSGERRRLAVALALATGAPVLLLDEPTAHVDVRGRAELFGLLARIGRTVVMTVHEFPLPPAFFTRAVLLEDGRLVADGNPDETVARFLSPVSCASTREELP